MAESGDFRSGVPLALHRDVTDLPFVTIAEGVELQLLQVDIDAGLWVIRTRMQPGVTLHQLDEALKPHGLVYPVFPGESSASLGGNVATNAGGMRAVRYGVTRHQVLGLTAVLGTGEVLRTGGRFVKATSGYDLTQLIIGSEGTLGVVTKAFELL